MTGVAKVFNFCGDEDQTEERSCQGLTRWWVLAQFRHCTKWRGSSLTRRQKKRTKRVFIYMCRAKTKAELFGENRLKADFIRHLTRVSPTLPSTTSMTIWAAYSSEASSSLNTTAIWSALTKRWNLIINENKILKIGEFSSLVQIIVSIVTVKFLVLLWDKVFHKWHSVSQRHYV